MKTLWVYNHIRDLPVSSPVCVEALYQIVGTIEPGTIILVEYPNGSTEGFYLKAVEEGNPQE